MKAKSILLVGLIAIIMTFMTTCGNDLEDWGDAVLEINLKNFEDQVVESLDYEIEIINNDGIVTAKVEERCQTPSSDNTCSTNDDSTDFEEPFIQLDGNDVVYVEVCCSTCSDICNSTFTDQVRVGTSASGTVDTAVMGVYQIRYMANLGDRTVIHIRNVIVRDSTNPIINFPAVTNVSRTAVTNYCPTNDVTISDNSGESINAVCEGRLTSQPGPQSLKYTATDSSGNTATKHRTFNVN